MNRLDSNSPPIPVNVCWMRELSSRMAITAAPAAASSIRPSNTSHTSSASDRLVASAVTAAPATDSFTRWRTWASSSWRYSSELARQRASSVPPSSNARISLATSRPDKASSR